MLSSSASASSPSLNSSGELGKKAAMISIFQKDRAMPVEMYYEIFQHLDYHTLEVIIPQCCRLFRGIVNDAHGGGPLAANLFSEKDVIKARKPSKEGKPDDGENGAATADEAPKDSESSSDIVYKLHPIFMAMHTDIPFLERFFKITTDSHIFIKGFRSQVKLTESPIANQNATSPPILKLEVQITSYYDSRPFAFTGPDPAKPLKVIDVMNQVVVQLNHLSAFAKLMHYAEELQGRYHTPNYNAHTDLFSCIGAPGDIWNLEAPHLWTEVEITRLPPRVAAAAADGSTASSGSSGNESERILVTFRLFGYRKLYAAIHENGNMVVPVRYEEVGPISYHYW